MVQDNINTYCLLVKLCFYLCGIDSLVESKVEKLESKYFFRRGLIRRERMETGDERLERGVVFITNTFTFS